MARSILVGPATPVALVAPTLDFPGAHSTSGTNTLLTITLAAPTDIGRWQIEFIHWSYDAAPTDGTLTITDGNVTSTYYIASGGPGFLPFGVAFAGMSAVTITLSAGGVGVDASLTVIGARVV